jgi:hypothetical protein
LEEEQAALLLDEKVSFQVSTSSSADSNGPSEKLIAFVNSKITQEGGMTTRRKHAAATLEYKQHQKKKSKP